MAKLGKTAAWGFGILLFLGLLLLVALPLVDDPLGRYLERRVNEALSGYTFHLGELDLNPFDLGLILEQVVLVQDAHPDPPVVRIEEVAFSLHWRELLSLRLVGELEIDRFRIHANLEQLREESRDEEPLKTRGWREALERIYPLEINRLEVADGEVVYIDEDPDNPLLISHIDLRANNIRNIRHPEDPYPSPFEMEALIFGKGYGHWSGEGDFLASPHVALTGGYRLEGIPLDYLKPILARKGFELRSGILSSSGRLEFSPETRLFTAEELTLEGLRIDYLLPGPAEKEGAAGEPEKESPPFHFRIGRLHATGEAGLVNRGTEPTYRLFVDKADLTLRDFSTDPQKEASTARLTGRFMGSGSAAADAAFRLGGEGPDFTLDVRIVDSRLRRMNGLLQAHADLDVAEGSFSLFAEATVRDGRIDGYVKPFFADVDVFSLKQDKKEGLLDMAYEAIVDTLAELLENEPREIATRVDLSGPVEDPEASTLQIALNLVRNAFFQAIIPGLESNVGD